jgi:hypothetical protein
LLEGHRIVERVSERLASAERLGKTLQDQLIGIDALPGALLRRAFSGQL